MNAFIMKSSMLFHKDQSNEDHYGDSELENIIGRPPPLYFCHEYWDQRYKKDEEIYDWYQKWDQLRSIVVPEFSNRNSALDIGCGSSTLALELVKEGFQKVVGMDISKVVIERNKLKYSDIKNLEFVVGDVLCMKNIFNDDSFDVIFDKGTMDCLMGSMPTSKNVPTMINEILRILKPNGVFIEISYGTPKSRLGFFEDHKNEWIISEPIKIQSLNEEEHNHYIYIAEKNPQLSKK